MSDPAKFDFKTSGDAVAQVYEELLVPRNEMAAGAIAGKFKGITLPAADCKDGASPPAAQ